MQTKSIQVIGLQKSYKQLQSPPFNQQIEKASIFDFALTVVCFSFARSLLAYAIGSVLYIRVVEIDLHWV